MNLVLFDLDHTLIPFDSNSAWMDYLVRAGATDADAAAAQNKAFARQYIEGTFDPRAYHRSSTSRACGASSPAVKRW